MFTSLRRCLPLPAVLALTLATTALAKPGLKPLHPAPGANGPYTPLGVTLTGVPEVEPNDDMSQAQDLPCGSLVTGATLIAAENDWYKVTVPAGLWLTVRTQLDPDATGPQVDDCVLELYDESGTFLIGNDDFGAGTQSRLIHHCVTGGTYYIHYYGYNPDTFGAYQLWATCTTPTPNPNENCETALPIACGDFTLTGDLSYAEHDLDVCPGTASAGSEELVYGFDGLPGQVFTVTAATSEGDLSLYLQNGCIDGTQELCPEIWTEGFPQDPPATLSYVLPAAGHYAFVVDAGVLRGVRRMGGAFTIVGRLECSAGPVSAKRTTWGGVKSIYR